MKDVLLFVGGLLILFGAVIGPSDLLLHHYLSNSTMALLAIGLLIVVLTSYFYRRDGSTPST